MTKKSKIIVFVLTTVLTAGTLFATLGRQRCQKMREYRKECRQDSTSCQKSDCSFMKKDSKSK